MNVEKVSIFEGDTCILSTNRCADWDYEEHAIHKLSELEVVEQSEFFLNFKCKVFIEMPSGEMSMPVGFL